MHATKPWRKSFSNLLADSGQGLTVELVSLTGTGPVLAALEVLRLTPQGSAAPTVALQYMGSTNTNWTSIPGAAAVPLNRWGDATFAWTIPSDLSLGSDYRIRAVALSSSGEISDTSNQDFLIANSGSNYFVSPTGNNRNSGKRNDQPVRSLFGLVNAYDLDAGDTVQVLGGTYRTYRNVVLNAGDSGVTFYAAPDSPAVIDRGNINSASARSS